MNKLSSKILIGFLVMFLVLDAVILIKFNNITEDVNRNFNKLSYLEKNIDEISDNLNKIGSKQDWIINKDYKILEIDKNYKNVTVMVYGNLNELENQSRLYLLYGKVSRVSVEDIKWKKVPLNVSYGLRFSKQLKLPYKEDYRFKILSEGPTKVKSEELLYVFLKNDIKNRLNTHIFEDTNSSDKDTVSLNVNIENNYKAQEKFKVKNIIVNVYFDNKLHQAINVYKDGGLIKDSKIKELHIDRKYSNEDKDNLINKQENDIEKLNYNIKIEKDLKDNVKRRFEIIIQDYMGEEFIQKYPDEKQ